jgi:hypothetical protein
MTDPLGYVHTARRRCGGSGQHRSRTTPTVTLMSLLLQLTLSTFKGSSPVSSTSSTSWPLRASSPAAACVIMRALGSHSTSVVADVILAVPESCIHRRLHRCVECSKARVPACPTCISTWLRVALPTSSGSSTTSAASRACYVNLGHNNSTIPLRQS